MCTPSVDDDDGEKSVVARAMMNMGLAQLYLVSPKKFPHDEAVEGVPWVHPGPS